MSDLDFRSHFYGKILLGGANWLSVHAEKRAPHSPYVVQLLFGRAANWFSRCSTHRNAGCMCILLSPSLSLCVHTRLFLNGSHERTFHRARRGTSLKGSWKLAPAHETCCWIAHTQTRSRTHMAENARGKTTQNIVNRVEKVNTKHDPNLWTSFVWNESSNMLKKYIQQKNILCFNRQLTACNSGNQWRN